MIKNLVAAIATAGIFFISLMQMCHAMPEPTISVEPSYLKVSQGDTFTVNITVNPDGIEIGGAQYALYFNSLLLNVIEQTKGPFLSQDGVSTIPIRNDFNNTIGKVEYGEVRMGDPEVIGGVTTPGVLASITFEAVRGGVTDLKFGDVILTRPNATEIQNVTINNGTVEIKMSPAPFLVYGYIFYEDDSECNNPIVNIINLNTSKEWRAETNTSSNYYQLMISHGIDIIAGDVLQFNFTSPDGSKSNITNHTITQQEIHNGGIFNFNITLEAKPGPEIFDTGAPENPYPSIFGMHRGVIIPDQDITVNKIYTYPCPGTGGHSESVIIWNDTIGESAEAYWNGYTGDYHNLSFNRTITLKQDVIYNYTIKTGSYPQIIHTPEFDATGGKIKCAEFIDANGKKYNDWIVAIKLFFDS
ncbi:MAG: hypothetical protein DRN88_05265 [Candidatus Hydrothermarchaeota archaeon]|nr:MAG: hypothetical protein DRN88_05265 [Candidatus Hydrothermarchaeota archaeon]